MQEEMVRETFGEVHLMLAPGSAMVVRTGSHTARQWDDAIALAWDKGWTMRGFPPDVETEEAEVFRLVRHSR